jgi:N-acetyl-gamma-glutamyl-phosphate reductase
LGSNYCHIFPFIEPNSDKLILLSCIDNLVKGTAGQAVQNMNLMYGLDETEGILDLALYP